MQEEKKNLPAVAEVKKSVDELIRESLERVKKIEEELDEEIKIYNETMFNFEKLKDDIASGSLAVYEITVKEIVPEALVPELIEDDQKSGLEEIEQNEPKDPEKVLPKKELKPEEKKHIKVPSKGAFGKFLYFLAGSAVTFGSLLFYASYKLDIKIDSFNSFVNNLDKIAKVIGEHLSPVESSQIFMGNAVLFGGSFLVGLILWQIKKYFINKKNLSKALNIYNETLQYENEKKEEIENLKNLSNKIKTLFENLKTLQVFLDEMNAKIKRIIHIEGKNSKEFTEKSKKDLEDAQKIKEMIIVIQNLKVEDELEDAINASSSLIETHKNRLYS